MNTIAIIQARMSSTRLPGKVLKTLIDKSVLAQVVSRLQTANTLDDVVVATTTHQVDDVIVAESRNCKAKVFRGSEDDVLSRYAAAAAEFAADVIVRITSDCPLLDPELIDKMARKFLALPAVDYLSNTLERTYPRGLDVEIFRRETLSLACEQARQAFEREHVTPYIYQHTDRFRLASYVDDVDRSHFRWTLDTERDWQCIEAIYRHLYQPGKIFTTAEVYALLQRYPEIAKLNHQVQQKTLEADRCGL